MANDQPRPEQWFASQLPNGYAEKINPIMVPVMALMRKKQQDPPDEALVSWHRMLASARTTLRQSEIAFIESAQKARWPDQRIKEALGLASDQSIDDYFDELRLTASETHPSRNPAPWTGGEWAAHEDAGGHG